MKIKLIEAAVLGIFFAALPGLTARAEYSSQEWEVLRTGEVVASEVLSIRPDGTGSTDVLVKAWIKAPPEEVWNTIRAYNTLAEFFPRVRLCRIFKQAGESYWVVYHTELLGITVIYHLKLVGVEKYRRIDFYLDHEQKNDVKEVRGFWVLDEAPEGKGSVLSYSIFVETGIPMPEFVARKISKPNLVQVVKNVRRRVESGGTWKKPAGS